MAIEANEDDARRISRFLNTCRRDALVSLRELPLYVAGYALCGSDEV